MRTTSLLKILPNRGLTESISSARKMFEGFQGVNEGFIFSRPTLSLEIVKTKDSITLYLHTKKEWKNFIIAQILAHYPKAEVIETNDYWDSMKKEPLTVNNLFLPGHQSFDREKEQNYISALLSLLEKQKAGTTVIQYIFRPAIKKKVCCYKSQIRLITPAAQLKTYKIKELTACFSPLKSKKTGCFIKSLHKRKFHWGKKLVLTSEQMSRLFHLPEKVSGSPLIEQVKSRKLPPPVEVPVISKDKKKGITAIGKTNYRDTTQVFGIKPDDRRRHLYIIGKTGMGKSTLLSNLITSDIINSRGVGLLDPHGDLAEYMMGCIPTNRSDDVVYFNPSDTAYPMGFNVLDSTYARKDLIVSGVISTFRRLFSHFWGPRLEHILRNVLLTLVYTPNNTLMGVGKTLTDPTFQNNLLEQITDPVIKAFWLQEYQVWDTRQRAEYIAPIMNKIGHFLSTPLLRNILGQHRSTFSLSKIMDTEKIFIANLSKGKLGEDISSLLGKFLITQIQMEVMRRADLPEEKRKDFFLYADEFQNFATGSFATILSEARKYRLNLTLANQYLSQVPQEIRDAVFGNVGSLLTFQTGYSDGTLLSNELGNIVSAGDIASLEKYHAYIRLLVNGYPHQAFSFQTLPPDHCDYPRQNREKLITMCREKYGRNVESVEKKIGQFFTNSKQ